MGIGDVFTIADHVSLEWLRVAWTTSRTGFLAWSLLVLAIGFLLGWFIEKLRRSDSQFKNNLSENRINAIKAIRPVLSQMTSFELLSILGEDKDFPLDFNGPKTISALHGIVTAHEYGIKLNSLLDKHDAGLTLRQRAALTNLNNLQYGLVSCAINLPDDENKDLLFAVATLPIAKELKNYTREIIKSLDHSMNKERDLEQSQSAVMAGKDYLENTKSAQIKCLGQPSAI